MRSQISEKKEISDEISEKKRDLWKKKEISEKKSEISDYEYHAKKWTKRFFIKNHKIICGEPNDYF